MKPWIIALAVLIGAFRPVLLFKEFNPHVVNAYTAFAHIFIGMVLGFWLIWRAQRPTWVPVIFWTLCAIEVVCALIKVLR
jgi:hypothetical protein